MNINGVLPPIPTPFDRDGLRRCGGDGRERDALDGDAHPRGRRARFERRGAAPRRGRVGRRASRQRASGCPPTGCALPGPGANRPWRQFSAAKRAADLGADAVLVRTPSYFKPLLTPDAFTAHYTAVADASPVPVVLYNFTALTGVTLGVDVVARLAEHPNIVGMKESGSDLTYVSALIDATPDDFAVMAGSAPVFCPALVMGAAGGVLAVASVVPDLCTDLYDAVRAGRLDEARALQRQLTPIARASDLRPWRTGTEGGGDTARLRRRRPAPTPSSRQPPRQSHKSGLALETLQAPVA